MKIDRQELPGKKENVQQVPSGTAEIKMSPMSYHSFTSLLFHCVFSTKDRLPLIAEKIQRRLWSYMGGIARENDMRALAVGGMRDHVHLLLSLSPTMAISKGIQLIKAGSSKWMHEQMGTRFEWQVGYGAFTIGISQITRTTDYILNQRQHHVSKTFAEEWKIFLKRHGLREIEE